MKTIRIATRKSKLALWQAEWVRAKLEEAELTTELHTLETKGDKILDVAISKIGSKGVFTEELEELLGNGEVDIAVHSAKDMASTLHEGFELIAFGERASQTDVLVSNNPINLDDQITLGTSSTRRVAQLARLYPHIKATPVRGNLQTRVQKMEAGDCDALLLAKAGVERMGMESMIVHEFSLDQLTPAAGQGSVAIEAHSSLHPTIRKLIRAAVNHSATEKCILAERAFLKKLEGGCSIPVFANAKLAGGEIHLHAGILSIDGSEFLEETGSSENPDELGTQLADKILSQGGDRILSEIKKQLGYL